MGQPHPDKLKKLPLFRQLPPSALKRLTQCMYEKKIASAKVLFEQGAPSNAAFIVVNGLFSAELVLPDGGTGEMARMGTGAVFGELCLIRPGPRSLRVRALQSGERIGIDRERFETLREQKDAGAYRVLRNICVMSCDRLRNTNEFIERELRHEQTVAVDETLGDRGTLVERARHYLSTLFGKGG